MTTKITEALSFAKELLREGEIEKLADWYNSLRQPDQGNVEFVLRQSHDWMTETAEYFKQVRAKWEKERETKAYDYFRDEFFKGDYFIVSAIGSTLESKGYLDVDLLFVTNKIWRDMSSFQEELLEKRIANQFSYKTDPNISEAYDRIWGRPARTLVTLKPKQGDGKTIHLTVQPEVMCEYDWLQHDKEPKVIIYRFGDTSGHHYIP